MATHPSHTGEAMADTAGFNARVIEEFRANHGQLGGGFAGARCRCCTPSGHARVSPG